MASWPVSPVSVSSLAFGQGKRLQRRGSFGFGDYSRYRLRRDLLKVGRARLMSSSRAACVCGSARSATV